MDYFSFFSLPRRLNLDTATLEKQFYTLSRKLHPDRFTAKPAAEQEEALRQSSQLNDAYRTLKDPILRTQYVLSLEGVEMEEQSKAATEAARTSGVQKKQAIPPELLEEVFELNMQLTEMRAAKQMGEDEPELRRELQTAKQGIDEKMAATDADLRELWGAWDTAVDTEDAAGREAAKQELVTLLNKRTYLRNLTRDVNEALET